MGETTRKGVTRTGVRCYLDHSKSVILDGALYNPLERPLSVTRRATYFLPVTLRVSQNKNGSVFLEQ